MGADTLGALMWVKEGVLFCEWVWIASPSGSKMTGHTVIIGIEPSRFGAVLGGNLDQKWRALTFY
jgi:hypothetical protein